MRRTTFFLICVVVLCALGAAADNETDARQTIARLEKSVDAGTASRAEQLELARAYIEVGRHYEAKKIARALADANPSDAEAVTVRDRADEQMKLVAQQRVADAEAAANAEGATDADRLELANAYFSAGRYREAADLYAKQPAEAMTREVRLKQARAFSWSGQLADAENRYATLIAEESSPELEVEYGRVLTWMGAEHAAITRLQQAYDRTPSEDAAVALAHARVADDDREGAVRLLTDFTASHPNAYEANRLLAEIRDSPDLQIERLDKLIDADPYNLALRYERARLLYDAGRYGQSLSTIEFIRENANGNLPEGLAELERNAEARRQEKLAELDEKRKAMTDSPMYSSSTAHSEQILELAKAYTGLGAYPQALDLYETYLERVPADTNARINYARVLSWDRQYNDAEDQYELVLRDHPDRADVRLEYAQVLKQDQEYVHAVRTLRPLTDLSGQPRAYLYEDVPPRAHYHLGQIYRWFGWRETAARSQNAALSLDGSFVDAQRELERTRFTTPGSQLEARYTTETTSSDFTLQRGDLQADHWLNPRTALQLGIGRHNFEQRGVSASANVASVGALYRQSDNLSYRARVGGTFWDEGLGTRPFFGLGAVWLPNLQSRAALDYNHYDLIYDVSNLQTVVPGFTDFRDPLSINDFRAHYDWDSGGFLSALGDASYGFISDDNKRWGAHGLVAFRVLKAPFVALKVDGRMLSYDFRSSRYWSPDDYNSLAGVIQVGQDINNRVFWSAEFKAGKSWEGDRSSDLRAWGARVTVPIGHNFDLVGAYNYGRSGRFESIVGDPELTTYWQRSWYVGVRLKRLFSGDDSPRSRERYYYDDRVLSGSTVIPPEVR